jgi:hypothetical protein
MNHPFLWQPPVRLRCLLVTGLAKINRSVSCTLRFLPFCIWMVCGELTCAQELPEAGNKISESGPQLHPLSHQARFRAGELIPLELEVTSATSDCYQINLATYDRSGRMSYEDCSTLRGAQATQFPLGLSVWWAGRV